VAVKGGGEGGGAASTGSRQSALAPGAAGQMIVKAAITAIGAEIDGRAQCGGYGVSFAGKALFLAADGEAGAHGVGFRMGFMIQEVWAGLLATSLPRHNRPKLI
jgi:hypothetical protein